MVHSKRSLSQRRGAHSLMKIDLMRRLISQNTLQPLSIVILGVPRQLFLGIANSSVFLEVDFFVMGQGPQMASFERGYSFSTFFANFLCSSIYLYKHNGYLQAAGRLRCS
jgi:hypothetical protein